MIKVISILFTIYFFSYPPARGEEINKYTFGSLNTAAGKVLVVNNSDGRAEILGFKNDSEQSKYANKDHVGFYIGMYGPSDQIITEEGDAKFYTNGFSLSDKYGFSQIKLGMFVVTNSKSKYSGRIISINKSNGFITVSGWYKNGDAEYGQIPEQGSRLVINAADKIWGQNTNVFISRKSSAKTATGYELGIISDGSHGNPIWGFHAANLSNVASPYQQAFRVTGSWDIGLYTSSRTGTGIWVDSPIKNGIVVNDVDSNRWKGSALLLNSDSSDSVIIKSTSKTKTKFYIKSNGMKSNNIQEILRVARDTNISLYGPSIILCKNKFDISLNLPPFNERGVIFEVRSVLGGKVIIRTKSGNFTVSALTGSYAKIINDGSGWVLLQQSY
ncbi:hypothetical protein [Serratia fonticola]|uniref:hypothetical protein n=2 Tax=Serratia fonticola TaxID=47917 RepID=UPI0027F10284|nr:hypothetical protein [Serratia fonticola]MDQ7210854.1 hypothetical protein [Serratia fonticola]HBE9080906.1 hypothetical protein [Serratia fonticola]HBE9091433.1 hypothetical protein [Serratia fonticola]HBE9153926.1 hypothetical protein [Serratia fonticola]